MVTVHWEITDMKNKMQCMFRMDDITADMNWDKFNQVREIFEKYEILPLLGIVPQNQDKKLSVQDAEEDFWEIIRSLQKQGFRVAQHGTYHKYVTEEGGILGLKKSSEFAGLSYEEQLAKLRVGKETLEQQGIHTDIFMAPGHTFDVNTVKALHALGFHTITDGLYHKPYYLEKILFVPCRLQEYRNVKGIDTICLHSNLMSEKDMQELEAFCKLHQKDIIPFDSERIKGHAVKRNFGVVISEKSMLFIRKTKDKIANSVRLTWYMQYTYDKNNKKKLIKRIFYLPMLIVGRKNRGNSSD